MREVICDFCHRPIPASYVSARPVRVNLRDPKSTGWAHLSITECDRSDNQFYVNPSEPSSDVVPEGKE